MTGGGAPGEEANFAAGPAGGGRARYEAEIRAARRRERTVAIRSLIPFALVGAIIVIYLHFH